MTEYWLLIVAFLLGALPLSVWVTHLAGKDPRAVGDKNPGATNALKAGGKWVGLAALMLDISKAAAPVGLAYQILGLDGPWMVAIALAPSLGHAYSPFLRFQGGKALATVSGRLDRPDALGRATNRPGRHHTLVHPAQKLRPRGCAHTHRNGSLPLFCSSRTIISLDIGLANHFIALETPRRFFNSQPLTRNP
jgi:hypothetical protein